MARRVVYVIVAVGKDRVHPIFWFWVEWLKREPRPRMMACVVCGFELRDGTGSGQLLGGVRLCEIVKWVYLGWDG